MKNKTGKAWFRGKKLYFDDIGWALVKAAAKKTKKSPRVTVLSGLKRGMKLEKTKNT